jgi:hypothetical protein
MEIKRLSNSDLKEEVLFLHSNARNVSKDNGKNSKLIDKSPEENGFELSALTEIDICYSEKYKSSFVKLFYGKLTFRLDYDSDEEQHWIQVWYSFKNRNKRESRANKRIKPDKDIDPDLLDQGVEYE